MRDLLRYALQFEPILVERLWGGRRLATVLAKPLPESGLFGESWEISDHAERVSIVTNGVFRGLSLRQLIQEAGEALLGELGVRRICPSDPKTDAARFPLLIKWIDAQHKLSVQVHPPDGHPRLPPGEQGKTECWFIVDAEPGAELYVGVRRGVDRRTMEREIARGTVQCCLNTFPARRGDFFFVPAGTPHAIGAGVLLAEIQQTSDTTFRLFDWNRIDPSTGRPRELHEEAALECICFDAPPVLHTSVTQESGCTELLSCPYFTVCRRVLAQRMVIGDPQRFHIVICLSGSGQVIGPESATPLKYGEVALLPACSPFHCVAEQRVELLDVTV